MQFEQKNANQCNRKRDSMGKKTLIMKKILNKTGNVNTNTN